MSFCQDRATSNNLHKNLVGVTHSNIPHWRHSSDIQGSVEGPVKCNRVEVRMAQMAYVPTHDIKNLTSSTLNRTNVR